MSVTISVNDSGPEGRSLIPVLSESLPTFPL